MRKVHPRAASGQVIRIDDTETHSFPASPQDLASSAILFVVVIRGHRRQLSFVADSIIVLVDQMLWDARVNVSKGNVEVVG